MNNKILQSLIEKEYLKQIDDELVELPSECPLCKTRAFNPIEIRTFVIIQQALFDACAERGYPILISDNRVVIFKDNNMYDFDDFIHEGNTTRESWVAAYKKVTGIEP